MKKIKKLKQKVSTYFSDVSTASIAESGENMFIMKKISKMDPFDENNPSGFEKSGLWHHKKANHWGSKEINGWISSVLPLGKRSLLVKNFHLMDLDTGEKIYELPFTDFLNFLEEVHQKVELKLSLRCTTLVHFAYFKWCYKKNLPYQKEFGFVVQKLITTFPIEEFQMLKQSLKESKSSNIREDVLERLTKVIAAYTIVIIDKEKTQEEFMNHFEEKLEKEKGFDFQVRLIIIDQINENPLVTAEQQILQKKTKRIISPLVSLIPFLKPEFGIFHVGIQLGPAKFYCEWTTSSIIFFKELKSTFPVMTLDLEPLRITRLNYERISQIIATTIFKWNTDKEYNLINLNCQHFVIELARDLGIKISKHGGAFKKFLNYMKKKGKSEMYMEPSMGFKKLFKLKNEKAFTDCYVAKKDKYLFHTHEELDLFCNELKKQNNPKLFKSPEWKLLKAFDETFWIRYFNDKKFENFKRYKYLGHQTNEILCPFIEQNDKESEIYQKIISTNEEWNERWYKKYLNDMNSFDLQNASVSFKFDDKDL